MDVNTNRVVWTRWYGLPLHAWSNQFFASACATLGLFIKLEDFKDSFNSLEAAHVLISTTNLSRIERVLKIRVDGKVFSVRVMEEFDCSCNIKGTYTTDSDNKSNEVWSEDGVHQNIEHVDD